MAVALPVEPSPAVVELRRRVATAGDAPARALLRVALADHLAIAPGGPRGAAEDELVRAAAEAPDRVAVRLAVLAAGDRLAPAERLAFLARAVEAAGPAASASWQEAMAGAAGQGGDGAGAAAALMRVATADTEPGDRRLRAARQAARALGRKPSTARLAALRSAARLSDGGARRRLLAVAIGEARAMPSPTDLLPLARAWLEAGGAPGLAEEAVRAAAAARADAGDVRRALVEVARRAGARAVPILSELAGPGDKAADAVAEHARKELSRLRAAEPAPAPATPARDAVADMLEGALAAVRAREPVRARRLAETAARLGGGSDGLARLTAVENALRRDGFIEDAFRLRRVAIETRTGALRRQALESMAGEAQAAGLPGLAAVLRADAVAAVGPALAAPAAAAAETPRGPAEAWRAAQRQIAEGVSEAERGAVLVLLGRALAGHPAADAALAAALAMAGGGERPALALLEAAIAAETDVRRRTRLLGRLADRLEASGDLGGAAERLAAALPSLAVADGAALRHRRRDLLRRSGDRGALGLALEADAAELGGALRLDLLAERAVLLDAAGDGPQALELGLAILSEAPARRDVLLSTLRHLEAGGRKREAVELVERALVAAPSPAERRQLLPLAARLREEGRGALEEAAAAWIEILAGAPEAEPAFAEAERLLGAVGDGRRLAELLGARAARLPAGPARAGLLWRLAELRRSRLGDVAEATRLLHELRGPDGKRRAARAAAPRGPAEPWQALAELAALRAEVGPTPVDQAEALLDHATVLIDNEGDLVEASRDLGRALDLDPLNAAVVTVLERLAEADGGGGRWAELGKMFRERAAGRSGPEASRLWFGAGRVDERLARPEKARAAYEQAQRLDPAFRAPVAALRMLATARSDWKETARLLEIEEKLAVAGDRAGLLAELGDLLAVRLAQPARARSVLEEAAALAPDDPRSLDHLSRLYLDGNEWEKAAELLERLAASGAPLPDASLRFHRLGLAAEAAGDPDRALVFFAKAYARSNTHRPTLERLAVLCFERGHWDNAWKACEALLDNFGAELPPARLAELCVSSALADLHLAQRLGAAAKVAALIGGTSGLEAGVRDIADSWAAMRIEPRLVSALEGDRRRRVNARVNQALGLDADHPEALQIVGALAVVDERWPEAVRVLGRLGASRRSSVDERFRFLVAAGDVLTYRKLDRLGGQDFYRQASVLRPGHPALAAKLDDATDIGKAR